MLGALLAKLMSHTLFTSVNEIISRRMVVYYDKYITPAVTQEIEKIEKQYHTQDTFHFLAPAPNIEPLNPCIPLYILTVHYLCLHCCASVSFDFTVS